jgi:hypothetical protein
VPKLKLGERAVVRSASTIGPDHMHFFQARLGRDTSGCMLVEGTPVPGELELLLDANFLILEHNNGTLGK